MSPKLRKALFDPVPNASVVFFRVAFGLLSAEAALRSIATGWLSYHFELTNFHFHYFGFEWVRPPGFQGMYVLYLTIAALGLLVAAGAWYRSMIVLLAAAHIYTFLLDETLYLNHGYLICLLSVLLALTPAHRAYSIDAWRRPELRSRTIPGCCVWLLRFQIALPYVYGGLTKLSWEWLRGAPMFWFLKEHIDFPIVGAWLAQPWMACFFAWSGLIFDLSIVPAIAWRRTRPVAFGFLFLFHLTNAALFKIGIFPWLMLAATPIFCEPDWPLVLWPKLRRWLPEPNQDRYIYTLFTRRMILIFCGTYVVLQLSIPFRHFLYPGNVDWTEQGTQFSWRMMARHKEGRAKIHVLDVESGEDVEVNFHKMLNPRQVELMQASPDLLLQFAHHLKNTIESGTSRKVEIHVDSRVSLNGRPELPLIDPKTDLGSEPRSLGPARWILEVPGVVAN